MKKHFAKHSLVIHKQNRLWIVVNKFVIYLLKNSSLRGATKEIQIPIR